MDFKASVNSPWKQNALTGLFYVLLNLTNWLILGTFVYAGLTETGEPHYSREFGEKIVRWNK